MTLPLITPVAPVSNASNVPTASTVKLRLTQLTAEAKIDESTITMAVGGANAINVEFFGGDGDVQGGTNIFKSLLDRIFTANDIGKSLFVTSSANTRNRGKMWVTGLVAPNQVSIERQALTGTASITATTTAVNGSGTLFLSEVAAGDWIVLGGDYSNPLKVLTVSSNISLTLASPSSVGYTGVSLNPIFHTNDSIMDWKLQSFAPNFNGTIKPYASGPAAGFEVEVWPVKQLTGTATIPQPVMAIPTGTTLVGISSEFLSELHQASTVVLAGKRTHQDPIAIPSVATDTTVAISAYPKANAPLAAYRDADLTGTPTSGVTIQVVTVARDTLGRFVTFDPIPISQPVSSYSFFTSTRPKVTLADPKAANPFGLAVRVAFSEDLIGYASGTNTPIADKNTYSITPINPALPTPAITTVVVPPGNPAYVDVFLASAMINQQGYRVTVKNLGLRATPSNMLSTTGNKLDDAPYNSVEFLGYGPVEAVEIIKDTLVAAPTINGPVQIDYQTPQLTYELHNLDTDVVAIQLGPQASGVELVAGTFINNHDGTGTVQVAFSSTAISFRISVEVIDDVDNVSLESNVLGVVARAETIPGTSLQIRPQYPVHQQTCDRLLADIPQGTFYLRSGFVLAYNFDPIPFTLKILEKGVPVSIAVTREGSTGKPETIYQSFIPQNLTETVELSLGRGRNLIYVTDGNHHDFIIVSATTFATVLCAIANEIYSHSQIELDEVHSAIYSPVSSRLAEPYLAFPEILPTPSVRSQQTLALKLAVRAHVVDSGSSRAVNDMTTAVSLQTSVPAELHNPSKRFQPAIDKVYTTQEAFGGFDMHTWFHNECMNRWDTFIRHLSNSPERYRPIRITEDEILFDDSTGTTRRHLFDFSNPACSSLSSAINCFDNIQISMNFFGDFVVPFCAAAYPFDSCFTSAHPLGSGRATFDSMIPWDSGVPLDYDLLDPGDDGWVGFCWADRWDSGLIVTDGLVAGKYTAGSSIFEDLSFTFSASNIGQWIRVTSGQRPGTRKILAFIDIHHVRLDYSADITDTPVTWQLVRDVHPLDSMGPAPAVPISAFTNDGSVIQGTDVFTTGGQYGFTVTDVGRNLIITDSISGVISVIIVEVVGPSFVRVGLQTSTTTTTTYAFPHTETGLNWELWDATPPSCLWDGYANKMVALVSSDLSHQVALPVAITLDCTAATMNKAYAPVGNQTRVHQAGGVNNSVTTIPVTSTTGFAASGILLIGSEIITYAAKTSTSFTGCVRGTNGTTAQSHAGGTFTTLNGALNATDTSIIVVSTTGFQTAGTVTIDTEQITYTSITPTSLLGCVRGANSTTAASHLNGATVLVADGELCIDITIAVADPANVNGVGVIGDFASSTQINQIGGINAFINNVTVLSTAGFDPSGGGKIFIGSEQMMYSGTTSTTFWGMTRGVNGTTATSHPDGAGVTAPTSFVIARSAITAILGPATLRGNASLSGSAAGLLSNGTTKNPDLSLTIVGNASIVANGTGGTALEEVEGQTTIAAFTGTADPTITVHSTSGFPDSGTIHIGGESIFYTSVDATHFLGCIRGYGGSTAGSYAIGTAVLGSVEWLGASALHASSWMSGQSVAELVSNATLTGNATLAGSEITQILSGSATLAGQATVLAVGSIA